ncbi:cob(I)yrinic acid a,c-diamide adenosyltransferase [Photorhabdus laumondii subsp. laumondii]|uniref:Corrinoid adenosyltransferase n=1 Tax=Photorhabdus laumondii subsp. laumondii TaxID=141679 RepID=A0A6L9JRI8_PHOLM|nr:MULTISPECIES: cob(I)yrinic acid a,c-diamide adenosyltransferase [Photorhabdus]MCC8384770.1 cob(I)yrinic acid a,c-diamide adenosyltransferase [Photorhabdus laumondii]MCC8415133.1 cob(I)yrinic acid a,c-diamide adenosyltransferase [Photorhabdus laumondii]NDK94969.1 cob(I)yrinic acid a,c-diamide adenosyltransferase [Photorhabdus laumondii subsp. laumondii]NDL21264.1 cob(I)yrinic acid a,c-diamide adenosyltransferase [Photorhabdus laumondii subsp. laumondii]NDL30241.1 cob(I)yrinic acid a,c-diamid
MSEERYKQRKQRQKERFMAQVAAAQENRGIVIIYTGNGRGRTPAAMGTVTRALGHGLKAGVIQFIRDEWSAGERVLLQQHGVEFQLISMNLTGEMQNRAKDIAACSEVWHHALRMMSDPELSLVVLSELVCVINNGYLLLDEIIKALSERPINQTVIITGQDYPTELIELADTVSEMRPGKYVFT